MNRRISKIFSSLFAAYLFCWCWAFLVAITGWMILFRTVSKSKVASFFDTDHVPPLHYFDQNFVPFYWIVLSFTGVFSILTFASSYYIQDRKYSNSLKLLGLILFGNFLSIAIASRYTINQFGHHHYQGANLLDWVTVGFMALGIWKLLQILSMELHHSEHNDREVSSAKVSRGMDLIRTNKPSIPYSRIISFLILFLLSVLSVFYYAWKEHHVFWIPKDNGGYFYKQFFLDTEIDDANHVLYSISLLFGSLIAVLSCIAYIFCYLFTRKNRKQNLVFSISDCQRLAALVTIIWVAILCIPWQLKISVDIIALGAWVATTTILLGCFSIISPLVLVTLRMLKQDFDEIALADNIVDGNHDLQQAPKDYPRRSDFAIWGLLLFPFYPLLRYLRLLTRKVSFGSATSFYWNQVTILASLTLTGLYFGLKRAIDTYDYDDWRDAIKKCQFPSMEVFVSLVIAAYVFIIGRRIFSYLLSFLDFASVSNTPSKKRSGWLRSLWLLLHGTVISAVVFCVFYASQPFWGWQEVSKNVLARCQEFNTRHKYEITFLHYVFDYDRDGYSAVLGGADPDDFDPTIHAGYTLKQDPVDVPLDRFEVADPKLFKNSPNVMILYLEGVVPRAISAYGKRNLKKGLVATPYIDSIAKEGTRFNQTRCFYPSTWDAWLAVCSGRFFRSTEFDETFAFLNRYTRHNNIYKMMKLIGVDRWCHGDVRPYFYLLVPKEIRDLKETWQTQDRDKFSASTSNKEEEAEIWAGDKRCDRIVNFIDSLKPGEKFFINEHMADTHFDWYHTSLKRAKELGFPNGLKIYADDAVLPSGTTGYKHYENYFETITRMDAQIGRILNKLREKKLYENTIIVIVSDHGCQWYEHQYMYYVAHLYDQSLHIPLIIKSPNIPGGVVVDTPVLQIDVMPTVMELLGLRLANPSKEFPLPSRSLVPLMRSKKSPNVVKEYVNRDVPLITHYDMIGLIHHFKYKLIFDRPGGTYLLFDLKKDPKEMINLADSNPELLEEMMDKLRKTLAKYPAFLGGIKKDPNAK